MSGCSVPVRRRVLPVTLTSPLSSVSQDGRCQLVIACQPETQHRARYQTEGSRGAVKDRSGNGFPIVKVMSFFFYSTCFGLLVKYLSTDYVNKLGRNTHNPSVLDAILNNYLSILCC